MEMALLQLAAADDGKCYEAEAGSLIEIKLEENPTTGFLWAVEQVDSNVLALQRSEFEAGASRKIGAGGFRRLVFEARCGGETELALKLSRSWEGDASIVQRFGVTLRVR